MSKLNTNIKQKALKESFQKFKGVRTEKAQKIELGKRAKPNIAENQDSVKKDALAENSKKKIEQSRSSKPSESSSTKKRVAKAHPKNINSSACSEGSQEIKVKKEL